MRSWKFLLPLLASTLCFAAQPDRIAGPIDSSQRVALPGNVHGLAQPRFDLGRTDSGKLISGVTLAFRPSAAQQQDLNNLLAEQQDRSSSNFHKWLTPSQFADRFGMSLDDVNRVDTWLESQGFTVTSIANSRNQISFDGTVAQIEAVFGTEIHDYVVEGEIHFGNATNPSVPAALAPSVLAIGHLHNFSPKPRAIFRALSSGAEEPHFTSSVSGNHFVAPGDFATIYDIPASLDGTGQAIALTGQSSINLADVAHFRSAASLSANVPTLLLIGGASTRCAGDEGESDLDVEWSGAVAQNASIILVYGGLAAGEHCGGGRQFGAFEALQFAIDNDVAPVISNSYGNCEGPSGVSLGQAQTMQGWIQQANAQGQTVMTASGDSGAADCDFQVKIATQGIAVDIPAAIPEVTAMGGTEFTGDAETVAVNGVAPDTPFWFGTNGSDTISSARSYIPEVAWNDTITGGQILASGGGASTFFSKPSWQTGTGVPPDGKRDVPDLALNASPNHDPYLFCSEDGQNGMIVATCTSGFRTGVGGGLAAVGGTSAAAPTFAGIIALLNQHLGTFGLGNINPTLYGLAATNPAAFHDVTTGNNMVPCSTGSPNCPATPPPGCSTPCFGFAAGVGYDQVTGLGSVDANVLFNAWPTSRTASSITITPSANNLMKGTSVTFSVAVTPSTGVGTVSFSTLNNGSTTVLGTATLNIPFPPSTNGTAAFTTTALPGGSNSVTATYEGDAAHNASISAPTAITVTVPFTMSASALTPASIPAGQITTSTITITPISGFSGTVSFTNSTASTPGSCTSGLPAGALCSFNPTSVPLSGNPASPSTVMLTIATAANMALPPAAQSVTVTGTSGTATNTANVNLTVTATNQSFTLASTNGATFPVSVGGSAAVQVSVTGTGAPIPFVSQSLSNPTTALPLTYTCTGVPSLPAAEISCQLPNNGQPDSAAALTVNLVTTPVTAQLLRPTLGPGSRIFYALLLPGLFGLVFAAGSRARGLRLLSLIVVLGCSTLWLGACGGGGSGNNSLKNPGTPPGSYVVTISAATGGPVPLTNSNVPPFTITLTVQ